jgi:hypothetical protein
MSVSAAEWQTMIRSMTYKNNTSTDGLRETALHSPTTAPLQTSGQSKRNSFGLLISADLAQHTP